MRRLALLAAPALAVVLALVPGLVSAQETPTPPAQPAAPTAHALRVTLDLTSQIDGAPEPANTFQYHLFERLTAFGIRVDSAKPVGQERLDGWMQRRIAKWEQQEPGAPPATLTISGTAGCTYSNSEFFGQAQAHNFKGRVDVSLKDAAGTELHRVALDHEWGRLPQRHTKSQVNQEYNQMVFNGVLIALLHRPELWSGIPEGKRAEARAWIEEQKERILSPLEANQANCPLVTMLKGLTLPE